MLWVAAWQGMCVCVCVCVCVCATQVPLWRGIRPDGCDNTVVQKAAANGQLDVTRYLVEEVPQARGVNPYVGSTLFYTADAGFGKVVRYLVAARQAQLGDLGTDDCARDGSEWIGWRSDKLGRWVRRQAKKARKWRKRSPLLLLRLAVDAGRACGVAGGANFK